MGICKLAQVDWRIAVFFRVCCTATSTLTEQQFDKSLTGILGKASDGLSPPRLVVVALMG